MGWAKTAGAFSALALVVGCGGASGRGSAAADPNATTTSTPAASTPAPAGSGSQPAGEPVAAAATPPAPPPPAASPALSVPPAGYRLVWSDEFEGTSLDSSKWDYLWPGQSNRGYDISDPATVAVQGGLLTITIFTVSGIHHVGLISTAGKYAPTYGYVEARIKFDGSSGAWCSFWLQTPTMGQPVGNTAVAGAEIDVMEHRAYDNSSNYIGDLGQETLNWDSYSGPQKQTLQQIVGAPDGTPLQGNWHTYGVLWTSTGYTFTIDGVPRWQTSTAVSQRSEEIRLTCEVGDWVWAGGIPSGGYGSMSTSTTKMQVDYVRVYQP